MESSKPDPAVPGPTTSSADNAAKDSTVPGQSPSTPASVPNPSSTPQLPVSSAAVVSSSASAPAKEPQSQESAAKQIQQKSITSATASTTPTSTVKPGNQEQVVTTSVAPATSAALKSNPVPSSTAAPVSGNSSTHSAPPTNIPDSRAVARELSAIQSQNSNPAIKRSQPEADTTAPPSQSMDSDSSSVSMPKRKKIKKDKEFGKPAQPPQAVESKDSGSTEQSEGKSDNSGPKVPPIKIVLQPHGPANNGSGNNGQGTESDSANVSSHAHHSANGSGFPYVVSSTTPDTTTTTTPPASVPAVKMDVSTGPQAGSANEKASDQTAQQISKLTISGPATSQASLSSGPVSSQSSAVSGDLPVTAGAELKKDPVVKLDVMANVPTSVAVSSAAAAKEITPVVTSASSSVPSTTANSATHVPTSSGASSAAATSEETPMPATSSVPTPTPTAKEQTTPSTSKEKPQRVTRSSQRIATNTGGVTSHIFPLITPNSPGGGSPRPSTSACPSPNHVEPMDVGPCANQKVDAVAEAAVELGSKKRRIKAANANKEPSAPSSSSSSTSGEPNDAAQAVATTVNPNDPPLQNCVEMFLNIRKQIERRRRNLFPVQPKPPQGFKDYLMNRGTYVLASNSNAQLAVPTHQPPPSLPPQCKDMFIEQEKERHKLRIQQVVEKEKLVLSVEQEILRVHGRAARALSNQALPFSVCTILKDQEVYNLLTPEQEEKDRNARSRYNGRLFLSWLQDVDDKWDKIKEAMLLRHHNEAESLHAVQKMDWEWKLKEVGLCEPKANPQIDEIHVPMVHVSDDFDLLPA